jgi:DNA-binding HxlR family transcriptional regulator
MQCMLPSATRRVLNVQLTELEHHGLISKTVFPELPPKVEYSLTDLGRSLLPVMEQWGNAHLMKLEQVLAGNLAELPS